MTSNCGKLTASHRHATLTDVSFVEKLLSASVGALLTSLVTTPLDVVKTRLQAAVPRPEPTFSAAAATCIYYPICKEADASYLRTACVHVTKHAVSSRSPSTMGTMISLAKNEGVKALWSGLSPSLVMALPSTTVYYAVYDEIKNYIETHQRGGILHQYAPLIAGITGRALTTSIVAPLELMRTKLMYKSHSMSLRESLVTQARSEGLSSLWRGLSPSLWRDVPFSGVYWLLYERIKESISAAFPAPSGMGPSFSRTFSVAFASGVFAGAVAAVVTTPFDVVKTRRQVQMYREFECHTTVPHRTADLLKFMYREEGVKGLFAGVTARVAKVAPACAIMISCYELGKHMFARVDHSAMT